MTRPFALKLRAIAYTAAAILLSALASPGALADDKASDIGLELKAFEPARMYQCKDEPTDTGAVITAVTPGSGADRAGLKPGGVIFEIERETVDGPEDIYARVAKAVKRAIANKHKNNAPTSHALVYMKVCPVVNTGKAGNFGVSLDCKYKPVATSWPWCPYVEQDPKWGGK